MTTVLYAAGLCGLSVKQSSGMLFWNEQRECLLPWPGHRCHLSTWSRGNLYILLVSLLGDLTYLAQDCFASVSHRQKTKTAVTWNFNLFPQIRDTQRFSWWPTNIFRTVYHSLSSGKLHDCHYHWPVTTAKTASSQLLAHASDLLPATCCTSRVVCPN